MKTLKINEILEEFKEIKAQIVQLAKEAITAYLLAVMSVYVYEMEEA